MKYGTKDKGMRNAESKEGDGPCPVISQGQKCVRGERRWAARGWVQVQMPLFLVVTIHAF